MLIRCPECLFERKVDLSKIPPTAQLATCPKCSFKFRFREYIVGNTDAELEAIHPPMAEPSYTAASEYTPSRMSGTAADNAYAEPSSEMFPDRNDGAVRPARSYYGDPAGAANVAHDASDMDGNDSASAHYASGLTDPAPSSDVAGTHGSDLSGHSDYSDYSDHSDAAYSGDPLTSFARERYGENAPYTADGEVSSLDSSADTDLNAGHTGGFPSLDPAGAEKAAAYARDAAPAGGVEEPAVVKPHRHLGAISDYGDGPRHKSGKGDIWDAIAAMGDDDSDCADSFIRHSVMEVEIPWENRGRLGLLAAWWQTGGQALFSPSFFFSMIKGAGGIAAPFVFFLFTTILGVSLEVGGLLLISTLWGDLFSTIGLNLHGLVFDLHTAPLLAADFLGEAVIRVLVMAIAYHVCLRLVGVRCKPFASTFRVMAYSSATALFGIIPVAGIIVSRFWFLILSMIGMHHAHNLSWRKTILVILPLYMLSMVVSVLLFVVGG